MKLTCLPLFKCKFLKPSKKLVRLFKFKLRRLFKFKLRRPLFIRSLRFSQCKRNLRKMALDGSCSMLRSLFHSPRAQELETDGMTEHTSILDTLHDLKAPNPSPITPVACVRITKNNQVLDRGEVEDARRRSFDKYLLEMIVEGRKMRDLGDVEELLYCWHNLNSPVFIDLVCRFYRELCKDLFSNTDIQNPQRFLR